MAVSHRCRSTRQGEAINERGITMEDKRVYLLAELTIRPGFLEEVKAILAEALKEARNE